MPKNGTSFSSSFQPNKRGGGRTPGTKNKKTQAQEAFTKLDYSPMEAQVAICKDIQERLLSTDPEVKKGVTTYEYNMFLKFNETLISYEHSKAVQEQALDVTTNGQSITPSLDPKALAIARKAANDRY